jgi:hypothetical protein
VQDDLVVVENCIQRQGKIDDPQCAKRKSICNLVGMTNSKIPTTKKPTLGKNTDLVTSTQKRQYIKPEEYNNCLTDKIKLSNI